MEDTASVEPHIDADDAGAADAMPRELEPVHRRGIDAWFARTASSCRDSEEAPAGFRGTVEEAREYACPLVSSHYGPYRIDPSDSSFENPEGRSASEAGIVWASVGSGDIDDYSWEIYFRLEESTGEVVDAWFGGGAACPFVVVRERRARDVRWIDHGEILRNLRGPDREVHQRLDVPVTESVVRLRIEERKNEVTYLDELYLEHAGRRVRPVSCARDASPEWCRDDGRYARIEPGERIAFEVRVPSAWVGQTIALVADGHYRIRLTPPGGG